MKIEITFQLSRLHSSGILEGNLLPIWFLPPALRPKNNLENNRRNPGIVLSLYLIFKNSYFDFYHCDCFQNVSFVGCIFLFKTCQYQIISGGKVASEGIGESITWKHNLKLKRLKGIGSQFHFFKQNLFRDT